MVAPLYVAEVAAANHRGPLGTAFQLLVTVGVFLAYSVGSVVSWSWLAVTGASLCFLHVVLLLTVPETPRWLLAKGDRQVIFTHTQTHRHTFVCYVRTIDTLHVCMSSSSFIITGILKWPKQQRHHEDHYSQSKYRQYQSVL